MQIVINSMKFDVFVLPPKVAKMLLARGLDFTDLDASNISNILTGDDFNIYMATNTFLLSKYMLAADIKNEDFNLVSEVFELEDPAVNCKASYLANGNLVISYAEEGSDDGAHIVDAILDALVPVYGVNAVAETTKLFESMTQIIN